MPQAPDSDRGTTTASVEAVRIARTCLAGEDVCVLLVGHDDRCLFATPLAAPLAAALAALDTPPPSAEYAGLGALLAQMRRTGRAAAGTVAAADGRLTRIFDVTVLPAADADRAADVAMIVGRDVTLATSMRRTLVESRQRYKDLVEVSAAFAWETNVEGTLVFVSPQGVLGYGVDELVGRQPESFLAEPLDGGSLHPFTTREPTADVEVWMRRADGSAVCLLVSAVPLYDDAGRWTGARGVCRDITDVRERDIAIARSRNRERLLSFIVRSFRDEVDPENMLTIAAATVAQGVGVSGCNVLRARPGEAGGKTAAELAAAANFGRVGAAADLREVIATFAAGHDIVETVIGKWNVLAAVTRYRQEINGGIVLWRELSRVPYDEDDRILLSDLSAQVGIAIEQISNHEHILALSRTDALTGLFNRRAFIEELERRTQRLRHDGRTAALLYVDLDNFKMVNDLFGHKRGDDALMEIKRLLQSATRPSDLVARLGGDEFAVWMDGVDETVAVAKAEGLLTASGTLESFSGGIGRSLSMSIGIAIYDPGSDESIDALLSRADGAMYQTKHSGKGSYRVAPATM
ncbi:FOG: GGDEF domain [uncultured Alphaproteobacteria bacterium]|uniref:FOG: GGDEF domain n=1 Tax=uncultured Alphaproteobacteria bacterium TaxID=91750 RepID=A0A212K5N0_9PROT|nr:FOG: GGDEF domain [uncultured Alphaproteobacteria bacterium]